MTRVQLRSFYTPEQRAALYASPYNHEKWEDHKLRIAHTAGLLREMEPESIADLSCGDGAIVYRAFEGRKLPPVHFGDLTAASGWDHAGPIEDTIWEIPDVDVFVLSETLEHVEDPDGLLRVIRLKARRLLLSTPHGESDSRNPEHYWGWHSGDVYDMLHDAGWLETLGELYTPPVPHPYYTFQIWRCT